MAAAVPGPQAAVAEALFLLCPGLSLSDHLAVVGVARCLGMGESSTMQKVTLGRDATELVRDDVTGLLLQAQEESGGSGNP